MMAFKLLVVGLTASLSQAVSPPRVFAIGTGIGPEKVRTISMGFEVDMDKGDMKQIATNFVYIGPSVALDGISTFDKKRGVFYWTNDAATPFVYRLNVLDGTLLAPIDTYGKAVGSLAFNDATGEVIIGDFPSQVQSRLIRYSESDVVIYTYTVELTPSRGVVALNNSYVNYDFNKHRLEIVDLTDGKVASDVALKDGCGDISSLFFNPSSPDSVIAIQGSLAGYNYTTIDLKSGSCSASINFDTDPVTSATYDPRTDLIWYAKTNGTGSFITTLSPKTGDQTTVKIQADGLNIAVQELALLF